VGGPRSASRKRATTFVVALFSHSLIRLSLTTSNSPLIKEVPKPHRFVNGKPNPSAIAPAQRQQPSLSPSPSTTHTTQRGYDPASKSTRIETNGGSSPAFDHANMADTAHMTNDNEFNPATARRTQRIKCNNGDSNEKWQVEVNQHQSVEPPKADQSYRRRVYPHKARSNPPTPP